MKTSNITTAQRERVKYATNWVSGCVTKMVALSCLLACLHSTALGQISIFPYSTDFARTFLDDANAIDFKATTNLDHVFDVRDYGAVGDGSTDDEAAIEAAEAAADDNGGIVYFPTGTYKFLTAIVISDNVSLQFAPGAQLMGDGSATLTARNIVDTKHQIFQSTMTLASPYEGWVRPEWWGAVPDDSTDCTAALIAADAAGKHIQFRPGVYLTDGWIINGSGEHYKGSSGYWNAGIGNVLGTNIRARGTQDYVMRVVSRFALFEHIEFDGDFTTLEVVQIHSPSIKVQFKHCGFRGTLDDVAAGDDGSSNGKLVYDNSSQDVDDAAVGSSINGDNLLFEDCMFNTFDAAKSQAEALNIGGSNAFLCRVRRCMFYYSRIHIAINGGGVSIDECEFENTGLASVWFVGSSSRTSVTKCYTEDAGSTFFRMTDSSNSTGGSITLADNTIGNTGTAMLLYPGQTFLLMNNYIAGNVQVENGAGDGHVINSINTVFATGKGWSGTDAEVVSEWGGGTLNTSTGVFTPNTHEFNIYGSSQFGNDTNNVTVSAEGAMIPEGDGYISGVGAFDVRDYGAAGDGVTDDTVAIQAAIDDANDASGGRVIFPMGDYLVEGTLTMYSNIRLEGLGSSNSSDSRQAWTVSITHDPTVADANLIETDDGGTTFNYSMEITGLALLGQSDGSCGDAISWLNRPINSLIEDCWIYQFDNGIIIDGGVHNTISRVSAQNYQATGLAAIRLKDGANGVTTTTRINNCYLSGHDWAVVLENAIDTTFHQTIFESCYDGGLDIHQKCGNTFIHQGYSENIPLVDGPKPVIQIGVNGTSATGYTGRTVILGGSWQGPDSSPDPNSAFLNIDYCSELVLIGLGVQNVGYFVKDTANTLQAYCWGVGGSSVTYWTEGITDMGDWMGYIPSSGSIDNTREAAFKSIRMSDGPYGTSYTGMQQAGGTMFFFNADGNHSGVSSNGWWQLGGGIAPAAELEVGNGNRTQVDGPNDLLIEGDAEIDGDLYVEGTSQFGNDTNNVTVSAEGELTLVGDATVWDDLRVPASSAKRLGNSDPDWEVFQNGVYGLAFATNTDQEVFFTVQIPHSWKLGSDLDPHVHWSPSSVDTGDVTWALEYTIADITGTFGNTVTITTTDAGDGTINKHQVTGFADIDMSSYTDAGDVSIILMCRLYRDVDNGDDYADDAFLLEFDLHYEIDTMGSNEEASK